MTNDTWAIPRFEKMGEDNSGLITLYLDASLVTGEEKYRAKALHAAAWVRARLSDPDRGVFYGSQASDSDYYMTPVDDRKRREPPPVDRTIFTPISSALASTFLRVTQVTGDPEPAALALRGLDFLSEHSIREGWVAHYYDGYDGKHDGEPRVFDLAHAPIALARALLDAFDHTGESRYLERAGTMMENVSRRFWSKEQNGLVDRASASGEIGELARPRKLFGENALAAGNFARLWRLTGDGGHRGESERILKGYPDLMDEYGLVSAEYALSADWLVQEPVITKNVRDYAPRRIVNRAGK